MDIDTMREHIARALENASPVDRSGAPLDRFEGLYLMGGDLPELGLVYDAERGGLIALGFADAFRHPLFLSFDFDQDWRAHPSSSAKACAGEYLLRMAGALRVGQLQPVEERLAKWMGVQPPLGRQQG